MSDVHSASVPTVLYPCYKKEPADTHSLFLSLVAVSEYSHHLNSHVEHYSFCSDTHVTLALYDREV
jgi:hypothetical protein